MSARRVESEMTRFDTLLWERAASSEPLAGLAQLVHQSHGTPRQPVTVETLIADGAAPLHALAARFRHVDLRFAADVAVMQVEHAEGAFVLSAWPTGYDGVFQLIGSVPSTDKRWDLVKRAIANSSPGLVGCFLDHADFTAIGTALTEHGRVEVSRITARNPIDSSSVARGWPQLTGTLRPDHMRAIEQAEEEGASVRTLTLQVSEEDETQVVGLHLRRIAGATFYGGDFDVFEDVVLARLAAAAGQRARLLTGRNRQPGHPLQQPIAIKLPTHLFTDRDATGKVLATLEEGLALSVAVLHRNPYLHVLVSDNTDGSNFDVVVTETDAIKVFPGYSASMGSLNRLTQRIGERFEAIAITEAATAQQVSLSDLVTNA